MNEHDSNPKALLEFTLSIKSIHTLRNKPAQASFTVEFSTSSVHCDDISIMTYLIYRLTEETPLQEYDNLT
jgi:hypothetical protein